MHFRSTLNAQFSVADHSHPCPAILTALRRTRSIWQGRNTALQFTSNEIRVISPAAALAFQKRGLAWLSGPGPQAQPAPWWAGQSMWSAALRSPAPLTAAPGPEEQEKKQTEQWKSLVVWSQEQKWTPLMASCLPISMSDQTTDSLQSQQESLCWARNQYQIPLVSTTLHAALLDFVNYLFLLHSIQ